MGSVLININEGNGVCLRVQMSHCSNGFLNENFFVSSYNNFKKSVIG